MRVPLPVCVALLLTIILAAGRAFVDWHGLSILRLPDTDDMMRLAEVRDWIGGQRFRDLTQYRLGLAPAGASMHWSRIADLGPAAFLSVFQPVLGRTRGALAMVIVYQAALLFAYLLLAAGNARALAGDKAVLPGMIFAALAFPTISLFAPGRIDHHALQIVLALIVVGGLLRPPSLWVGLAGGAATALSLAIGLELAPELIAVFVAIGLLWVTGGRWETARLAGLAASLGIVTWLLLTTTRPEVWPTQWCDGFTPASTNATLGVSVALAVLAGIGAKWTSLLPRVVGGLIVAAATAWWVWHSARICFAGPYAALDPFLKRAFMDNVGEAQGLVFASNSWGTAVAFGGLSLMAVIVTIFVVMNDAVARRQWWPFAIFLVLSSAVLIFQIRVSYMLGIAATLPFAALIARAEASGWSLWRKLATWVMGAGVTYSAIGGLLYRTATSPPLKIADNHAAACLDGGPLLKLAAYPKGNVMTDLDIGAYVIGMTPHRSFGGVYHRNNAGNLATYRFFLSPPSRAAALAHRLNVNYVALCDASFTENFVANLRHGSLAEVLQAGSTPGWLDPIASNGDMKVFRVRPS